jgi:DNA-binding winged helix-turn-helix (wHTH) protein
MSFFVGEWEVLPDLNRVRRGGELVELEPRVMAVLEELAREPGRVVTREDLHRTVWRDVIVTDDALNRCIRELRRLFGDDPRTPAFIETISKRGYRLIAPVSRGEPEPESTAEMTGLSVTLFGHRAEVEGATGEKVVRHETVLLRARDGVVRTRTLAAATPLAWSLAAFVLTAMLLYGRAMQYGHVLALSLIAGIAGAFAGMPARRRALDRSRAAIAAFIRHVSSRA